MNNRINGKLPCVPVLHFYILILFYIKRRSCANLYVRVSNLSQPFKCSRRYCNNKPCQKLRHWIIAHSTHHHKILHATKILNTSTLFVPSSHLRKKIFSKTKLSHSILLHPRMLHTSSFTSKYDSKITSIKWYYFPLGQIRNNIIKPQLIVGSSSICLNQKQVDSKINPVGSFFSWYNQKQVDSTKNLSREISLFILCSHIEPLTHCSYISLHVTTWVAC